MRNAYAILGLLFLLISVAAIIAFNQEPQTEPQIEQSTTETQTVTNTDNTSTTSSMGELNITSSEFEHQGTIPAKFTCDGDDINPPLEIKGVPEDAKSLVLIMDDPDAPVGTFDHWTKFNMPAKDTVINEGEDPEGVTGVNSAGGVKYMGPCPPFGEHRYFFKVFALDVELELEEGAPKPQVEESLEGHIIDSDELIGLYDRN